MFLIICFDNMLAFKPKQPISKAYNFAFQSLFFGGIFIIGFFIGFYDIISHLLFITVAGIYPGILFAVYLRNVFKGIIIMIYSFTIATAYYGISSKIIELSGLPESYLIPSICFLAFVTCLLSWGFKRFIAAKLDLNIFNHHMMPLLIFNACLSIVIISLNFSLTFSSIHIGNMFFDLADLAYLVLFVSSLILYVMIYRYAAKENALRTEMLINKSSKRYIKDLEESFMAMRSIKHDYVNILSSLKLYIDDNDIEGLKKYFNDEFTELNTDLLKQNQLLSDFEMIKISEIKSVFLYKCSVAASNNIEVHIDISDPLESIPVSTAILCQVLAILLDNALEAAVEADKKELAIGLFKSSDTQTFIIRNTWKKCDLELNKLFTSGYSTKAENRGFGLFKVRDLTNKIKDLYLDTEMNDEYFTQVLSIKEDLC